MPVEITPANVADVQRNAPIIAKYSPADANTPDQRELCSGPAKEVVGADLTVFDCTTQGVRVSFDVGAAKAWLINKGGDGTAPPRPAQQTFHWRAGRKPSGAPIKICNDEHNSVLPDGKWPQYNGKTLKHRAPNGVDVKLTGFLLDIRSQLTCILILEIRPPQTKGWTVTSRIAFHVSEAAIQLDGDDPATNYAGE